MGALNWEGLSEFVYLGGGDILIRKTFYERNC